jgi:hypothetical protein
VTIRKYAREIITVIEESFENNEFIILWDNLREPIVFAKKGQEFLRWSIDGQFHWPDVLLL